MYSVGVPHLIVYRLRSVFSGQAGLFVDYITWYEASGTSNTYIGGGVLNIPTVTPILISGYHNVNI